MLSTVDEQNPLGRHSIPADLPEPFLDVGREGRSSDVKTQLDGRGNLVDILAARTRGADKAFFDLAIVDDDRVGDSNHCSIYV